MEIYDIRTPVPTIYGDHQEKFGETWRAQIEQLRAQFGGVIEEVRNQPEYPTDVPIIYVQKDKIVEVLSFMRSDPAFASLFLDIWSLLRDDVISAEEARVSA